jgi:hypothetical protein
MTNAKAMTEGDKERKNAPELPSAEAERQRKAKEAFERGIIERGEAAPADEKGRLPPGVTHEIIGYDATGRPILKRRRFSAF